MSTTTNQFKMRKAMITIDYVDLSGVARTLKTSMPTEAIIEVETEYPEVVWDGPYGEICYNFGGSIRQITLSAPLEADKSGRYGRITTNG